MPKDKKTNPKKKAASQGPRIGEKAAEQKEREAELKHMRETAESITARMKVGITSLISFAIHVVNFLSGNSMIPGDNAYKNLVDLFSGNLEERSHFIYAEISQLSQTKCKSIGQSWWVTVTLLLRTTGFKRIARGNLVIATAILARNGGTIVETADAIWYRKRGAWRKTILCSNLSDTTEKVIGWMNGLEKNDNERFERLAQVILNLDASENIGTSNGLTLNVSKAETLEIGDLIQKEEADERMQERILDEAEKRIESLEKGD